MLNIANIVVYNEPVTLFRITNRAIGVTFDGNIYSLENFKTLITDWSCSYRDIARLVTRVAEAQLKPTWATGGDNYAQI